MLIKNVYSVICGTDVAVYTNEIYGPRAKASGLLFDRTQYFNSIERVRMLQKNIMRRLFLRMIGICLKR